LLELPKLLELRTQRRNPVFWGEVLFQGNAAWLERSGFCFFAEMSAYFAENFAENY